MKIRKQTKIWVTRDGRKIRICDMTDGHLQNTINMLYRAYRYDLQNYQINLCNYLGTNPPEGAELCAERELEQIERLLDGSDEYTDFEESAESSLPILKSMLQEQIRRKQLNPKQRRIETKVRYKINAKIQSAVKPSPSYEDCLDMYGAYMAEDWGDRD